MAYRRKNRYHYKEQRRAELVFNADPLTLRGPDPVDIENEKALNRVLKEAGCLKESKSHQKSREYVLQELNQTCQDWVVSSARKHNHPEEFVRNSRVRLYAFGSYKLDVHSHHDDVDLLCVGPRFLTRDMFFDELAPMLQSNSCISKFYAVRNAYVPVMSFSYNEVAIDIVYAQLQIDLLDDKWDITDDRNLRNLDDRSILSLNGVRLANKTLELVPNKQVFRLSLRAIRYWAKQRAIYSNKLGYLGGVSWAILTARVCQLYPNANASQIVQNFFLFYHIWNFGSPLKAITLCNIMQHEDMPSIKVWDPNDGATKYELMHIITPAFPAMNSTHNVSMSTFEVLKREIARGFHSLSRAQTSIDEERWKTLFARNTFFMDHKNYIFIKACAPQKNLTGWSGLIESKIRSMVTSLEQFPDVKVTPFCKAINLKLKKEDINAHTHPDVLKEMEEKRQKLIAKRKAAALEKKKREAERLRLEKLQRRLAREREEEKAKQEAEAAEAADAERTSAHEQSERERSGSLSVEVIALDPDAGDVAASAVTAGETSNMSAMSTTKEPVDSMKSNGVKREVDGAQTDSPIKKVEPSTVTMNGENHENDGNHAKSNGITVTKPNESSPSDPIAASKTKRHFKMKSTPSPATPDDDVILVSNLSMPVIHKSPSPPSSASASSPKIAPVKPRTMSRPNGRIQPLVTSQPANPYIYVAPELQRRYGHKRRYSRGGRGRYGANSRMSYNRFSNNSKGSSPAPSVASTQSDKKSDGGKGDRESSIGLSSSPMIHQINPHAHAFLVGKKKDHIACCQTFNNTELAKKAKSYEYQCRAFVIGLKTMNRVLGIETMADGTQMEQKRHRFDFTQAVSGFLKNLNHDFTDSHVIIQRISCHKIPHYLFPQYDNRRPDKEVMAQHQKHCEEMSKLWKSKSCIATIPSANSSLNGTPNGTPNATPNGSPSKATSAAGTDTTSKVTTPKLMATIPAITSPEMNDEDVDVDVMPGLGLPPASTTLTVKEEVKVSGLSTKENVVGNGDAVESVPADTAKSEMVSNGVTKTESNGTSNGVTGKRKAEDIPNGQPPAKRIKIMNGTASINGVAKTGGHSTVKTANGVTTEIIEHPLTVHPSRMGLVNETKKAEEEPINYANPYFKQIDWDKKFDDSLTFEYALKLYRKSQSFTSWSAVSHDVTATANHVVNTCMDQQWKGKLKKVLTNEKYGWNGAGYGVPLSKKLLFELAHDIAFNYVHHRKQKKKNWAF